MSQLKVNSIVPAAGLPAGASGGGIIQCISTTKTDTWSTSSTTFSDITDLSLSITPTSTNSKILIFGMVGASSKGNTSGLYFRLARGGSVLSGAISDVASNRPRCTTAFFSGDFGSAGNGQVSLPFSYLDSPATTSSTTYSLQARKGPNIVTLYVNRTHEDRDNADYEPRYISTFTLMEITG